MHTRLILAVVATLLLAGEARADAVDDMMAAKWRLNEAYRSHDAAGVSALTAPDNISISAHHRGSSREDQAAFVEKYDAPSYELSDIRTVPLTDDVILLTYRAAIDGTYDGRKLAPKVQVMETWVKLDGQWMQASYQETPVE